MFPNLHELTAAIQANTALMGKLLAEMEKLNQNTAKLTKQLQETKSK